MLIATLHWAEDQHAEQNGYEDVYKDEDVRMFPGRVRLPANEGLHLCPGLKPAFSLQAAAQSQCLQANAFNAYNAMHTVSTRQCLHTSPQTNLTLSVPTCPIIMQFQLYTVVH